MATTPASTAGFYADFAKMESLRATAQRDPKAAVKAAARQFEGLFTQMMLKSMRQASLGEGLGDSEETRFYQDMFDQQLSVQLSSGKGIGLADRLISQLQRTGQLGDKPMTDATPTSTALPTASLPAAVAPAAAAPAHSTAPASEATTTASVADTAAALSAKPANAREAFLAAIQPAAERVAQQLGVATETIMAHAALETGWGSHQPGGNSNNLLGVKAGSSWQGAAVQASTREVIGGQSATVQASFRSYSSLEAGLDDYATLIGSSPRYSRALNQGSDVAAYARGLKAGGYATDPAYVQKLVDTAASVRQIIAAPALKVGNPTPTTQAGATG